MPLTKQESTANLIAFAALFIAVLSLVVGQCNRVQDRADREQEATADLRYVDGSFKIENGYTILTFENKSIRGPAAVIQLAFEVSDPDTLTRIDRKHPRPRLEEHHPDEPVAMAANISDDAIFRNGFWIDDQRYCFLCDGGFHIPASTLGDIKLRIANPKWAGSNFVGTLTIHYNGPTSPFELRNVTIRPISQSKPSQNQPGRRQRR